MRLKSPHLSAGEPIALVQRPAVREERQPNATATLAPMGSAVVIAAIAVALIDSSALIWLMPVALILLMAY